MKNEIKRSLVQLYEYPPVDIITFTEEVLNLKGQVYPKLLEKLYEVWHDGEYWLVVLDGATGWGKTTFVKISLLYLFYNAIALRNPQRAFGFARGTQLSILGVGKTKEQARNVLMNDLRNHLRMSKFFSRLREEKKIFFTRTEIREPNKGVYLMIFGSLAEENILGLNLLGAVMEEANFWGILMRSKRGHDYNVASEVFEQLLMRFQSRYADITKASSKLPFVPKLIIASSNYHEQDLTLQLREEFAGMKGVYFQSMATWDTKPVFVHSKRFKVCVGGRLQLPRIIDSEKDCENCLLKPGKTYKNCKHKLVDVPEDYRLAFERDIVKALRDLAGIPFSVIEPFILYPEKVRACIDPNLKHPWLNDKGDGVELIKSGNSYELPLPQIRTFNQKPHFAHVDLGLRYDATGFAMGYIESVEPYKIVGKDGFEFVEYRPKIVIDLMVRIKPPEDGEIPISEVRKLIYFLRDECGVRFKLISFDSFQSVDSVQALAQKGFNVDYLSVDRTVEPYYALRDAIYEGRIRFYNYKAFLDELLQLEERFDSGRIDHPPHGSKDVADAVAGVVYHCIRHAKSSMPASIFVEKREEKPWWEDLIFS